MHNLPNPVWMFSFGGGIVMTVMFVFFGFENAKEKRPFFWQAVAAVIFAAIASIGYSRIPADKPTTKNDTGQKITEPQKAVKAQ